MRRSVVTTPGLDVISPYLDGGGRLWPLRGTVHVVPIIKFVTLLITCRPAQQAWPNTVLISYPKEGGGDSYIDFAGSREMTDNLVTPARLHLPVSSWAPFSLPRISPGASCSNCNTRGTAQPTQGLAYHVPCMSQGGQVYGVPCALCGRQGKR